MHENREWPFGPHRGGPRWRETEFEERAPRKRLLRDLEEWEDDNEYVDGADALEDLLARATDRASAARAVGRFTAVRLALGAASGEIPPARIDDERRAAADYVLYPSATSREAAALAAVVRLAGAAPARALADALCDAADTATGRGHEGGARSLLRAAYMLAVPRAWWAESARAAEGMEALARAGGGRWSLRLWRRRARILRRRAERESEAAAAGTA